MHTMGLIIFTPTLPLTPRRSTTTPFPSQLYDLFLFLNNPQVHFVLLMYLQDKAIYWSIVTFTRSYTQWLLWCTFQHVEWLDCASLVQAATAAVSHECSNPVMFKDTVLLPSPTLVFPAFQPSLLHFPGLAG